MASDLYVHFPFCRRKCSYCALHSRTGSTEGDRAAYVETLVRQIPDGTFETVYFGGGSPALCDLRPLLDALAPHLAPDAEFTVELHPLDVTDGLLATLAAGGVNRLSMGVQSLDDALLAHMGRGYTFHEAERAFAKIRSRFDNAGIDLIVGYPGETAALTPRHARLAKWGLAHCSAYSLILEDRSRLGGAKAFAADRARLPDDETVMNRLAVVSRFLADLGLVRYEISNYALPGRECRHNLAVWRGKDYLGLGEGAHGRLGLARTRVTAVGQPPEVTRVSEEEDRKERTIFRLRTREGLDTADDPRWRKTLDRFVGEGLLERKDLVYRLTERGSEVCDSVLAEIV